MSHRDADQIQPTRRRPPSRRRSRPTTWCEPGRVGVGQQRRHSLTVHLAEHVGPAQLPTDGLLQQRHAHPARWAAAAERRSAPATAEDRIAWRARALLRCAARTPTPRAAARRARSPDRQTTARHPRARSEAPAPPLASPARRPATKQLAARRAHLERRADAWRKRQRAHELIGRQTAIRLPRRSAPPVPARSAPIQTRRRRRPCRLSVSAAPPAPVSATSSRTMCTTSSSGAISVWRTRSSKRSRVRSARRVAHGLELQAGNRGPRIGKSDSASSPTDRRPARGSSPRAPTQTTARGRPRGRPGRATTPAPSPGGASPPRAGDPQRVQTLRGLVDLCAGQRRVEQEITGEVALVNAGVDVEPDRRRLDERLRELPFSVGLDEVPKETQRREQPSRPLPLVVEGFARGEIGFDNRARELRPGLGIDRGSPAARTSHRQQAGRMTRARRPSKREHLIGETGRDPAGRDVRRPARRAASGEPPANPQSGVRARSRSRDRRGSTWRRESRLPGQTGSGPVRAAATTQWTTSLPENAEESEVDDAARARHLHRAEIAKRPPPCGRILSATRMSLFTVFRPVF